MGIIKCIACDHDTSLPDEMWISIKHTSDTVPTFKHFCCPRCLVLWLEATYKPKMIGIEL